MRSVVDLPQPEGPSSDHELAVLDEQRDVVDRRRAGALEALGDVIEPDHRHIASDPLT